MKRLSDWFEAHPTNPRHEQTARPAVEELEARRVLSAATQAVASGIARSPENFGNFVTNEYIQLLGRLPDQAGFNSWVGQLERGISPEAVEAGITGSREYVLDHGNTPIGWLDGLYHDLLGRTPDTGGLNHWLGQLALGVSTVRIANAFATSVEREAGVIRQDYVQFLGRVARNDEVAAWLMQFQAGANRADVAARIVASDEFFADAGANASTFIVHAYQDVLNRTPAQSEVNVWLSVFNQAQSMP